MAGVVKPEERSWIRVLERLGISRNVELLWESSLDWGRRVYRSADRAYKIVLRDSHTTGTLRNRTMQEEAGILQSLKGIRGVPNFIEYRDLVEAEVMVTELVAGMPWPSYRGWLMKTWVVFPRLLRLLLRLSRRGMVHGDLKPENVVVDSWGYPWLVDFDQAHECTPFRSLLANLLGWEPVGVTNHGGAVQFVRTVVKSVLPRPVVALLRRVRRRLGIGASAKIPVLAPLPKGASKQLGLLHRAWQVAARSDANAPGQGLSYYSMTFENFLLPGERPWDERWRTFTSAIDWSHARVLELGCNLGLLSTFAKLNGAEAALGVDVDVDILEANRMVQQAFGVDYPTIHCNFDDARNWESELAAFRPTIVTALSVINWVVQKDRFMRFLGRFERVLLEGHDSEAVESQRLEAVGFTRIALIGRSERHRPVILASRSS